MTIQEFNKTKIGVKRPPFSKEWRENLSKSHLGQIKSPETIKKYKKTMKKRGGVWNKNKKMSKEFCEKTSKGHLGIKHTEETKQKHRELMLGDKNPGWKGGINENLYPQEWTDDLKESIRKRDLFVCQECGIHQDELTGRVKKLHVHHIDYNKENLSPCNLITLCNSCHMKTNHNRGYWENYFKAYDIPVWGRADKLVKEYK